MRYFENRTFGEIRIGDSASLERARSKPDIELFAVMSRDVNPAQLDEEFANSDGFPQGGRSWHVGARADRRSRRARLLRTYRRSP